MKRAPLTFLVVCLVAPRSHAHLVSTGFGDYYDGIAHLALTPGDLLLVIGMGLLAGLRGARSARAILVTLPIAWLAGGLVGLAFPGISEWPLVMALTFGVVGLCVALDLKMPRGVLIAIACSAGLLHGYVNGSMLIADGQRTLALMGAVSGVFILSALLPAMVVSLRARWMRISLRVAGSWLVAIGMLMVGWLMRGPSN